MRHFIYILAIGMIATSCNNEDTKQVAANITLPALTNTANTDLAAAGHTGAVHTVHRKMYRKFAQNETGEWLPTKNKATEYIETYNRDGYKTHELHIQNGDTLREMITTPTGAQERTMLMYNKGEVIGMHIIHTNGNQTEHKIYQIDGKDTILATNFSKIYKGDGRSFVSQENKMDSTQTGNLLSVDVKAIDDTITTVQKGANIFSVSKYTILSRDKQGNITKQLFKSDARKDYDVLTFISYTYYNENP